jgi:capsular polysaccharide transport system permease protein
MLAYRQREALLDPGKTSGALFETAARIQAELSATRIRLAELNRSSPGSPLREGIEQHIAALQAQMDALNQRLAGNSGSMAPKISEYEDLSLRQDFAAKELESALASLETARADARRQQIYVERVVAANRPDKALYPERAVAVLIVFVTSFMAYAIGSLLLAGVREHRQE